MPLTTINLGKESAVAYRPVILCVFSFSDGATLHASTHNADSLHGGYAYYGVDYLPLIDDQQLDQLAHLSEQGIDRVPSATIKLADPDGSLFATYERGHGFKGASVLLRFVLHDPETGAYSSDSLVPYLGICDQPSSDEKNLIVPSQHKLNLTRFMVPSAPIAKTCIWINPVTTSQRTEAANPASRFYHCGETRDLVTAPPCQYSNQTCTQPRRRCNSTWQPTKTGTGREYISGTWGSWRNADTSDKYRTYWPLWLGGKAWVTIEGLNQFGDGNFTQGQAAVGLGGINIERVILNGLDLAYYGGDYAWVYVNQGSRDGTPDGSIGYDGQCDPYGGATVIRWKVPKGVCAPEDEPTIQVLGTPDAASIPTSITIDKALQLAISSDDLNRPSFDLAWVICNENIPYTDRNGIVRTQQRFASSIALKERRSLAEIIRGLRQSIGGLLLPGQDGKIHLKIEGPLAEQQPAPVDGSNYSTPIASQIRNGTATNGYAAYRFDASNSWGMKRTGLPIANSPNRISFSFQDPDQNYAMSTYSLVDSDDVQRVSQEIPGGLQVNPEGIASYNFALRCAKLGLAKIHRGNPANDTKGTDWWEWTTSFRAVKLGIGDIVVLDNTKFGLTLHQVRLTEIRPSRNFETLTLKGHTHNDAWYMDARGNWADPYYAAVNRDAVGVPPQPTFNATAATGILQIIDLSFPAYDPRLAGVRSGTFKVYYVSTMADAHLGASLDIGNTTLTVDAQAWGGITEGDLVEIGGELILIGVQNALTATVTRHQLGGIEANHPAGAAIRQVSKTIVTTSFPFGFFADVGTDRYTNQGWRLDISLRGYHRVQAIDGWVSNGYGDSLVRTVNFGSYLNGPGLTVSDVIESDVAIIPTYSTGISSGTVIIPTY